MPLVLALDLSEKTTGVAYAPADATPQPWLKALRRQGEPTEVAVETLARWMRDLFERIKPDDIVVCVETYLPGGAASGFTTSNVRDAQIMLNATVRAICACYDNAQFETASPGTIRAHFVGQSSVGRRKKGDPPRTAKQRAEARHEIKAMVMRRAKLLGYLPHDLEETEKNFNLSDAAAIWDYSVSHFCRRAAAFGLT